MIIYLVGNKYINFDNMPLKLEKKLQRIISNIQIISIDPTEELMPESDSLIIDTVIGLDKPRMFNSLEDFYEHRSSSVHDYDLYLHLALLQKTKKIKNINILGVPPFEKVDVVIDDVVSLIRCYETSDN